MKMANLPVIWNTFWKEMISEIEFLEHKSEQYQIFGIQSLILSLEQ